jgi:hypothetical protein
MSEGNWETISSLATAPGTLVLAAVTVWSLRSANRAARVAEAALIDQRRPVLVTSRLDDPKQKIMFVDRPSPASTWYRPTTAAGSPTPAGTGP